MPHPPPRGVRAALAGLCAGALALATATCSDDEPTSPRAAGPAPTLSVAPDAPPGDVAFDTILPLGPGQIALSGVPMNAFPERRYVEMTLSGLITARNSRTGEVRTWGPWGWDSNDDGPVSAMGISATYAGGAGFQPGPGHTLEATRTKRFFASGSGKLTRGSLAAFDCAAPDPGSSCWDFSYAGEPQRVTVVVLDVPIDLRSGGALGDAYDDQLLAAPKQTRFAWKPVDATIGLSLMPLASLAWAYRPRGEPTVSLPVDTTLRSLYYTPQRTGWMFVTARINGKVWRDSTRIFVGQRDTITDPNPDTAAVHVALSAAVEHFPSGDSIAFTARPVPDSSFGGPTGIDVLGWWRAGGGAVNCAPRATVCRMPLTFSDTMYVRARVNGYQDTASVRLQVDLATPDFSLCGARFTMITYEEDSLIAQYGIPPQADTVDVCETWTGTDYKFKATPVGSSENIPGFADTVQAVSYFGGSVSGYAADGSPVGDPTDVGPTVFDFVMADEATRLASQDDPYYAVYSPTPTDLRICPGTASCRVALAQIRADAPPAAGRAYQFKRRGVRALVEGAEEIGRSPEGYRRFRRVRGTQETVLSVDPRTELLVGEETTGPSGRMKAKHIWGKTKDGYVRERTDIDALDLIDGRRFPSQSTITIRDVRLGGKPAP